MRARVLFFLLASAFVAGPIAAQITPPQGAPTGQQLSPGMASEPLTVRSLRVEGVEEEGVQAFVRQQSGIAEGQQVMLPGADLAEAIRSIYDSGLFSDVQIVQAARTDEAVDLVIKVERVPVLGAYTFQGIKKGHRDDLQEAVPLLRGRPARPADIQRAEQAIKQFYAEEGYLRAEVNTRQQETADGRMQLSFFVEQGPKVEVEDITFQGNEAFSDGRLRGVMETKEDRWWRFWKGEKFEEEEYEEDLDRIISYYNEKGYYDAQILSDSVYVTDEGVEVDIAVHEGNQYYIRDVEWEGNTVYPDAALSQALGFEEGDVYNGEQLETNLYGNRSSNDVSSLYLDRGYMRVQIEPSVQVVGEDSLDLVFDVRENDVYNFGEISIAGNTKTKEHVIRRELYTVPGQTFSRSAIQESIRRLMQLNYFSQESLAGGPGLSIDDEEKTVNLAYDVEEVGSDQLELSGTYGRYGIVLQLRFTFNNFSAQNLFNPEAWRPLPSGDGQQLSVGVQTNGSYYQNYSLSFTEPWFRGRPTPIGGSISYRRQSRLPYYYSNDSRADDALLQQFTSRLFYQQRLKWPDDRFSTSSAISYQYYQNDSLYVSSVIPQGVNHQVSFEQGISRSSLDNPLFPTQGSEVSLSLEVAPPLGDLIQYHKWRFQTDWNMPIFEKLSLNFSTDYGYVGSLTGEPVEFGRFDVGGSPFDYGRYGSFYSDPIFMRGYPAGSLNPRQFVETPNGVEPNDVPGTILNKYTSELRWMAVESQQLRAAPYIFLDAANTWDSFDTYDPTSLYRSAGVGARLFLPIIGMIEVNYGYNFDPFVPLESGEDGGRGWRFQISLGQGMQQQQR